MEHIFEILFELFDFNYMKFNSGKSHTFSGNDSLSANIDNNAITSANKNEVLGIFLVSKFSFE